MNYLALHAHFQWHHREHPSDAKRAELALRAVEDGLRQLASMGHPFHLVEGPAASAPLWPRVMYHYRMGARRVRDLIELRELGSGWYDSPSAAEMAEGEDIQFRGRGGVARRRQLPAITVGSSSDDFGSKERIEQMKRDFLAGKTNGHNHDE